MSLAVQLHASLGAFTLDVAFEAPARGVTALFGPSGAGKTRTLRAIAGLDRDVFGSVRLGDAVWQDADRFLPVEERRVGYVFQEASLFEHLDVRANIDFGLKRGAGGDPQRRDRLVELLELSPLLDRRVQALSGGERQRVALTRALATSPQLLLMDEPLAALDRERKDELLPYLEALAHELEIPALFVSHDMDEVVRLADHIVLIEDGRVRTEGPLAETLTSLDSPISHSASASSMLEGRVSAVDAAWELAEVDTGPVTLTVPAGPLKPGQSVRLRIAARDVSIALTPAWDSSILNVVPVTITGRRDNGALTLLELALEDSAPLLARVTRRSAEELNLVEGLQAFAQVKSVAVLP